MNTAIQIERAMARLIDFSERVAARRRWFANPIVRTVREANEFGLLVIRPLRLDEAIERAETKLRFREAEQRISREREPPAQRQAVDEFGQLVVKDANSRTPKFSAVIHIGGALGGEVVGVEGVRVFIDLAKLVVRRDRAALLLEGLSEQRVGQATQFSNDGRRLVCRGAFSAATSHRDEVIESARNGYPWQVIPRFELANPKPIALGETVSMNGQILVGPAIYSESPRLMGLSLY